MAIGAISFYEQRSLLNRMTGVFFLFGLSMTLIMFIIPNGIGFSDEALRCGQSSLSVTAAHPNTPRRENSMNMASKLRTLHNELEKTRRANLRRCFEKLKEIVPNGSKSGRHTTLGVLNRSTLLIKSLQQTEKQHKLEMEELERIRGFLLERLTQLTKGHYRQWVDSSPLTTNSVSSNDQDEIDVECTEGSSDCDEKQSNASSDMDAWNIS